MNSGKIYFAPHIVSSNNTSSIMKLVIIALLPTIIISIIYFGFNGLLQYVVGILSCVLFEYIYCRINKIKSTIKDYSAVVTGILLVMCMPVYVPIWITILGSFISIIVAKMIFGGIGQNPFNPALVGRTFLLISFLPQMTFWSIPKETILTNGIFVDAISSATVLGIAKNQNISENIESLPTFLNGMFYLSGSLGEVSAITILIGGIFLIYKKVITWHIPVIFIGTVFILSSLVWLFNKNEVLDPFTQIFSGGLFLGAFFMATDYSSSPLFIKGKIIFAIGCGVITILIRLYGGYPEGVAFAILIMNAIVPLLDKYFKPEPFGIIHE